MTRSILQTGFLSLQENKKEREREREREREDA